MPVIINQIMPAACLMAVLYVLGHLNKSNEITAMKATGISSFRILAPILTLGIVASIGILAINETITPYAAARSSAIKKGFFEFGHKHLKEKSLSNVTLLTTDNKLLFAREMRLDTDTLYDIIILDHHQDLTLKSKLTAQKGIYENNQWTFYGVIYFEFDTKGNILNKPEITEKKTMNIQEGPEDFIRQDTETRYMNYKQLKSYIKNSRITGFRTSNRLLVDLHQKIATPFTSFIILLVGAPTAMRIRRGGAMMSMGMGLLIVAVYYVVIAVSTAMGRGGLIPALLAAWLPHLIFLAVGLWLLRKYL